MVHPTSDPTCEQRSYEAAVGRVFRVKGRPQNHPLIVHLADAAMIGDWASQVPQAAIRLAERF